MRVLAAACACALANAFITPWHDAFRPRVVVSSTPGGPLGPGGPPGENPLGDGDGLWRPDDMAYLQARMEKIRAAEGPFGERRDEATMLYEMMTESHPSEMIRAFALGAGPEARSGRRGGGIEAGTRARSQGASRARARGVRARRCAWRCRRP